MCTLGFPAGAPVIAATMCLLAAKATSVAGAAGAAGATNVETTDMGVLARALRDADVSSSSFLEVVVGNWNKGPTMCPPGYAVVALCASNDVPQCTFQGTTYYTGLVCRAMPGILDPDTQPVMASSTTPPASFAAFDPVPAPGLAPMCRDGYVLTGACTSGRNQNCDAGGGEMAYSIGWCTAVSSAASSFQPPQFSPNPFGDWCPPSVAPAPSSSMAGLSTTWPLGVCANGTVAAAFCSGGYNVEDCGSNNMRLTSRCNPYQPTFGNLACVPYGAVACPQPYTYGPWSPWTEGDAAHGCNQTRTRSESCSAYCTASGEGCSDQQPTVETRPRQAADATYSPWAPWNVSCGPAVRTRTLSCSEPPGCPCANADEPLNETSVLPDPPVPYTYGPWSAWNATCGPAWRNRTESCPLWPVCYCDPTTREPTANTTVLPVVDLPLTYTDWTSWSSDCGFVTRTRALACPTACNCTGEPQPTVQSTTLPPREWTASKWSAWSTPCGHATRTRSFACYSSCPCVNGSSSNVTSESAVLTDCKTARAITTAVVAVPAGLVAVVFLAAIFLALWREPRPPWWEPVAPRPARPNTPDARGGNADEEDNPGGNVPGARGGHAEGDDDGRRRDNDDGGTQQLSEDPNERDPPLPDHQNDDGCAQQHHPPSIDNNAPPAYEDSNVSRSYGSVDTRSETPF